MILYTLRCDNDHRFEAWFRNSAAFDSQIAAGLLDCPQCGSTAVDKALMTPNIRTGKGRDRTAGPPDLPTVAGEDTGGDGSGPAAPAAVAPSPAMMARAAIATAARALRRQIEATCDHVGPRFAEEVRQMHCGEIDHRPVYGDATPDEAAALRDEGIDIATIPWIPHEDA